MEQPTCDRCGSTNLIKDGHNPDGAQKYRCRECGKYINKRSKNHKNQHGPIQREKHKGVGITLKEFREKHDVDYIVQQILDTLESDRLYEKNEIVQMTGLRAGYPNLSRAIEDASEYKGKAPGGSYYWGHPETIKQLKKETLMT